MTARTTAQERKRKAIERRLREVLVDVRDLAVEMGCEKPALYYESEGGLHVFDAALGDVGEGSASVRQTRVTVSIYASAAGVPVLDCGGW